jgi:diaminopimelate decarboxylase
MPGFERNEQGAACLADAPLGELLRQARASTPVYVYDLDAIAGTARELVAALGDSRHIVAYAVKANGAGSVVRAVANEGTGADVVSGAELEVACACGIAPDRVVMSGVGKTDDELDLAIRSRILAVQVESVEEIDRVAARALALGDRARIALRVNPRVMADTHAHIATGHDKAKFGIALDDVGRAWEAVDRQRALVEAVGVSTHVGSMLMTPDPYLQSARVVCSVAKARRESGKPLQYVDFGGGFGIDHGERAPDPLGRFVEQALALLEREGLGDLRLVIEPGRCIVGPHGVLVARVVQTKRSGERRWLMIDAGMNDLLRPALYQAHHRVEPLDRPPGGAQWRVVGPVCETADDFGSHPLGDPAPTAVVIREAGAYAFAMASQYNGRALPSEVFASSGRVCSVSPSPGRAGWVRGRLSA